MKIKNITIILGMIILLSGNVLAFAVSSEYWEENPVEMMPGETKQIPLYLQNMAGKEMISAQGTILEGSEIAEIVGVNTYTIPAGEKVLVTLEVNIPKKNSLDKYNIIASFKTSEEGTGTFALGNSVEREIPIIVKAKPSIVKENSSVIIILLALIVIGLIFLIIFKKKGKKKKRK